MVEINTVIHADCLDVMREMPDKSIDLVLTDPPYGVDKAKWDNFVGIEYYNEISRVAKRVLFLGSNDLFFNLSDRKERRNSCHRPWRTSGKWYMKNIFFSNSCFYFQHIPSSPLPIFRHFDTAPQIL